MITISRFTDRYTQEVIDLALHFQNDGTRPPVSVADQPDLLQIEDSYIKPGGGFWIATDDGRLVGTVGSHAPRRRDRHTEKILRL